MQTRSQKNRGELVAMEMGTAHKSRWIEVEGKKKVAKAWPAERLSLGQRAIIIGEDFTLWVVEEAWDVAALNKIAKDLCQEAMEKGARWVAYGDPAGGKFTYGGSFCRHLGPGDEKIATQCKQALQKGGAMIVAIHPQEEQGTQRIAVHEAAKVKCSMCEERGVRGSEHRPVSESPGMSRTATPRCKIGTASRPVETAGAPMVALRYPEEEYAVPVAPNARRRSAVPKENKGTSINDVSQFVYQQGEGSADEATIWQHQAYDDHLVQAARHQLWNGRTTSKVIMNRDDTSVSSGSRMEEIGSAFRLRAEKGQAKETRDKTESVSSFTTSVFSLSLHTEVEMERAMRELSDSNRLAKQSLDLTGYPDDSGEADSADSQSTIVFRTPRPLTTKVKEERGRSASTPPVLRVSRLAKGNVIDIESTSEVCHSANTRRGEREAVGAKETLQRQEDHVVAPHYGSIAQSVQPHIFLHLLAQQEHQQKGGKEIVQAILHLHDLVVNAGPGKVNDKPLQTMVQEVVAEAQLQAELDRTHTMERTVEAVFSQKNDFQGFEEDRDKQWGLIMEVVAGLKELKKEVSSLAKGMLSSALKEKEEEVERLSTEVAKKIATWPNNLPTGPGRLPGSAVKQSEDRSVEKVPSETEEYGSNQQAQKEKEKEKERAREQQSKRQQQALQVIEPALPLGTPARQIRQQSSEGSAYDTPKTFRQRCRKRLQDQERQMNQNRAANTAAKAQAVAAVNPTTAVKPPTMTVSSV